MSRQNQQVRRVSWLDERTPQVFKRLTERAPSPTCMSHSQSKSSSSTSTLQLNPDACSTIFERLHRTPTRLDKTDKRMERKAQRTSTRFLPLSGGPSIFAELRRLPPRKELTEEALAEFSKPRKISIS